MGKVMLCQECGSEQDLLSVFRGWWFFFVFCEHQDGSGGTAAMGKGRGQMAHRADLPGLRLSNPVVR